MSEISIIMPVYNSERYLEGAIKSILNQTFDDFELIVINDGSVDKSDEIVRSFNDKRIVVISLEQNYGVAYARNIGLEMCNSKLISLIDSDDLCDQCLLEKEFNFLKDNNNIDSVYPMYNFLDKDGNKIESGGYIALNNPKYIKAMLLFNNVVHNPGSLFRKKIIDDNLIRYDNSWKIGSDYKFWVEFSYYGNICAIEDELYFYRVSDNSLYNGSSLCDQRLCLDKIKQLFFDMYEINLDSEEQKIFMEKFGINGELYNEKEMVTIIKILRAIGNQCKNNGIDFYEELLSASKNNYLALIKRSDRLWG